MKNFIKMCSKSFLAGVLITIGGFALLMYSPLLFGFALLAICIGDLLLYTGKIGFIDKSNWKSLIVILLFNCIGVFCSVLALKQIPISSEAIIKLQQIIELKKSMSLFSLFLSGLYCGGILYVVCLSFRNNRNLGWVVWFGVTIFVLCGFDHVIADLFYFLMADELLLAQLGAVLLGNSCGSLLARLCMS